MNHGCLWTLTYAGSEYKCLLGIGFFLGWRCVCPQVPVLQEALMSALYIHLLLETCGPLKRSSPQVTVDHRAKAGPGFASSFVFEGKFCSVVLATQPRADHFKPASHVDCRITGPPRVSHGIKWGGWKSVGDSTPTLCNYQPAHVPITVSRIKSHSQRHRVVTHLCRQIIF